MTRIFQLNVYPTVTPDLSLIFDFKSSFNYGTHPSAKSRADRRVSCLPLQYIVNSREQQLPEYDNKSKEKKKELECNISDISHWKETPTRSCLDRRMMTSNHTEICK